MYQGKKVVVVMPAYNAAKTLKKTLDEIDKSIVDSILLVDDCSKDDTVEVARALGIKVFKHDINKGYGGNQKTCYAEALKLAPDIVVMIHPDYQYDATRIGELVAPIAEGKVDAMFGSRIAGEGALRGGMPLYKYISNRMLSFIEELVFKCGLSEYHTGLRAYSKRLLTRIPWQKNSDDFVFDTEIIAQIAMAGFKIGEIPIETRYFDEASSVDFRNSVIYGCKTLGVVIKFLLHKIGLKKNEMFLMDASDKGME